MTPAVVPGSTARTLPAGLATIVEALELDQVRLVTTEMLEDLRRRAGIATPARLIASRLRDRGWLLATRRRGVYEFAPGSHAGAVSRGDQTLQLQAVLAARPDWSVGLTMQSAAWALGLADRAPSRLEVAVPDRDVARGVGGILGDEARVLTFAPHLPMEGRRGVPVLSADSVVVQMAAHPTHVRAWQSALEWLPDLAAEATRDRVAQELAGRPRAVAARAAYLLSGLRPDISAQVAPSPAGKVWFGPREQLLRHDSTLLVADTILPFDPRTLSSVAP